MKPIATEPVEPRAEIKGNANRESTHRTQSPAFLPPMTAVWRQEVDKFFLH
jgi:hypothetical protein